MFEDSFVQAQVLSAARQSRWPAVISLAVQMSLAVLLVLLPMLRTGVLDQKLPAPPVAPIHLTIDRKPLLHTVSRMVPTVSALSHFAVPTLSKARIALAPVAEETPANLTMTAVFGGETSSLPAALTDLAAEHGRRPAVTPAPETTKRSGPIRVSSGVSAGLLLAPIQPRYPRLAAAAQVQGSVVIEALVSRSGAITGAHVLSGPAMLRQAALDALATAHYKPFYLNGEAVEVQTTVTINFTLNKGEF